MKPDNKIYLIILQLKRKADKYRPAKDETIEADHVVYGKSCDIKGALGACTPSAQVETILGCTRGKIYKRKPCSQYITKYLFDKNDRLIAITSNERCDFQRTVIVYEDDVIYAFEWSNMCGDMNLDCITVCTYSADLCTSCFIVETSINTTSFIHHEFFEYENNDVVRTVIVYDYYIHQAITKKTDQLFDEWDFHKSIQPLYAGITPFEYSLTKKQSEDLIPFLSYTPSIKGSNVSSHQKGKISLQKELRKWLVEHTSKEMPIEELILSFRQMLDETDRENEQLLFETGSGILSDKEVFFFRLVRQIPDSDGEFIQLELVVFFRTDMVISAECEWFDAADDGDLTYLDKFVEYIQHCSAYQVFRNKKVFSVKTHLDKT